jgi:hypothetical protein
MATVSFTVRYLDHLRPQAKRYEVFDMLVPGLAIRVTPAGHKSFTLYYRHHGRMRRVGLGRYRTSCWRTRARRPRSSADEFSMAPIRLRKGKPHIALLEENNARQGFFEYEQYLGVLKHLGDELRPVVTFAYITGWRVKVRGANAQMASRRSARQAKCAWSRARRRTRRAARSHSLTT